MTAIVSIIERREGGGPYYCDRCGDAASVRITITDEGPCPFDLLDCYDCYEYYSKSRYPLPPAAER